MTINEYVVMLCRSIDDGPLRQAGRQTKAPGQRRRLHAQQKRPKDEESREANPQDHEGHHDVRAEGPATAWQRGNYKEARQNEEGHQADPPDVQAHHDVKAER